MTNTSQIEHKAILRTLWYQKDEANTGTLSQTELVQRAEPMIILGEAGMGKSYLLEWLATNSAYARCTARQLLNRHNPHTLLGDAKILLIDALDEVSTQQGGDAVDQVLQKLGELGYPTFVLSCRVADWRSATGLEAINEQYVDKPLELHLEPFNDDDAVNFLGSRLGIDTAQKVIEHFNARNLQGLLGNPQTLELIVRVADKGELPETRSELFSKAIEVLRVEHQDSKASYQPAEEAGLNAAGAAFSALILTGSEALVRKAAANRSEGELLFSDIAILPGANDIRAMLSSRLFKADGADRFSYWHRRIGEFLAAHWLAKNANTPRKRRRLLTLFHSHGLVPANLRGLHAWLAREPSLALQVIAADPMGVIEYGDADDLSLEQARALINALQRLAIDNPDFCDWGSYAVRGIVQLELLSEMRELITHPKTPFGLRLLILEAMKGAKIASDLTNELRALVLDDSAFFANRSAAAEALVGLVVEEDWTTIIRTLHACGNDLSVRLAIEISDEVGYAHLDDSLIVDLIISHAQIDNHTIGILLRMQQHLPLSRLDGILDHLASATKALGNPLNPHTTYDITDFANHLIVRRVSAGGVSADNLWSWLDTFDSWVGYQQTHKQQLDELIRNDDSLRQYIQSLVLLEKNNDDSIEKRAFSLTKRAPSLFPTSSDDVIALLKKLDPTNRNDLRWREIVNLAMYTDETSAIIKEAALPFAAHRPDLQAWINKPRISQLTKFQIHNKRLELRQSAKRARKYAEQRQYFTAQIDRIRLGEGYILIQPAKAYLNLFSDLDKSIAAHERIANWLGDELADAARNGFEVFLKRNPPSPTAKEIANSLAKGRHWELAYVIVVALAERFRQDIELDDLTDECLMAGFFELRRSKTEKDAGIDGLDGALEAALHKRGVWCTAMRLYYEPQFVARLTYVDELYALMRDEKNAIAAADLADDWLRRFPKMPHIPELELVTRLLRSGDFDKLRHARERFTEINDEERRRNWFAIGVLVDFKRTLTCLETSTVDPEVLWNLKKLIVEASTDGANVALSSSQLEWIIGTFRPFWPFTHRQTGGFVGDKNAWDASDQLTYLIRRLGNDASSEASASLQRLRNAPDDGYTETIKSVASEQARIRVEVAYTAPTLDVINAIVLDRAPSNAADIQSFMIEELSVVQAKIKSDDAESWRGFYNNDTACDEERCRDHLLGLLRQGSEGIVLEPETHIAADKEVDITCSVGSIRIPIEIKGQWHPQLWQGADAQLDALYTQDWRANGYGIYLVLWFGEGQPANKLLKNPGPSKERPQSPEELRQMLTTSSRAASEGRVIVVVLDLRRP
ncbi:NACHT domain-containing protein [Janthinobacterium lividum]|uniref:NACHT domain-containing protein n=1 Tax=Janthinobacterium lividum TaxID=29581 RepID=UPI00196A4B92|nr:hypothetical protein [Janthinobacterium lividum]